MTADGAPYLLHGQFFELCDCYTICPCWVGEEPDDGRCTGAFGWAVSEGRIGDVDVAGRSVVSVSFHAGHRDNGGQEVHVFVDAGADDEQFAALVLTFTGGNGGPLGELSRLMGELRQAQRVPLELSTEGDHLSITVGRVVSGDAAILRGGNDKPTQLRNGWLSDVLGPKAEVGRSSAFRVDLGGQSSSITVTGRAAMRGSFTYESDGAS
jgi:hypothetical protein